MTFVADALGGFLEDKKLVLEPRIYAQALLGKSV